MICGPFPKFPKLYSGVLGYPLPFSFYLDGLKLAQAFSFYSRLLSAGKNLMELGGGAGRKTSNYRADEGISGMGTALSGRPTWKEHRLDRDACPQNLSLMAPSAALLPPTVAAGKLAALTGGPDGTDKALPTGGVWRPSTASLAYPTI